MHKDSNTFDTKAKKLGDPVSESGAMRQETIRGVAPGCASTQQPKRRAGHHLSWRLLFISVDFRWSMRPLLPLARPGMPGSRRLQCPLCTEVWVSSSHEKVGGRPLGKGQGCGRIRGYFHGGLRSSEPHGDPQLLGGQGLSTIRACEGQGQVASSYLCF